MKQFEDVPAQTKKFRTAALTRAILEHGNGSFDPAGAGSHDNDAIAHVDGFVNVMRHQKHRGAARLPEARYLATPRAIVLGPTRTQDRGRGLIAVVSAGTGEVTEVVAAQGSCAYDSGAARSLGSMPGAVSLTYLVAAAALTYYLRHLKRFLGR